MVVLAASTLPALSTAPLDFELNSKIVRQLDGAAPKKVIVVPDRLVNIVA